MSEEKIITCIVCPIGCKILVKTDGKSFELIEGNKCKKGIVYARSESLNPQRMLTSSILVVNGNWPLVSVKSSKPIPKYKVLDVLKIVKKTRVYAPIEIGQKLIENISGTGIDIIATKSIKKL